MTLYNVSLTEKEWIEIYANLYCAWQDQNYNDEDLGSVITEIKKQLNFL